jgi:hypothetical protein
MVYPKCLLAQALICQLCRAKTKKKNSLATIYQTAQIIQ